MQARLGSFCSTHNHPNGDTCLHIKMPNFKPSDLEDFITQVGADEVAQMARMVSDTGKIPLLLINPLLPDNEKILISERLASLALLTNTKPTSEPIDFAEVAAKFPDPELQENLKVACDAANASRRLIKSSLSHPSESGILTAEHLKKISDLREVRKIIYDREAQLLCSHPSIKYHYVRRVNDVLTFMLVWGDAVDAAMIANRRMGVESTNGVGNCSEMTYLAFSYVMKYNETHKPLNAMVMNIHNGDHVFMVLGDNLNSTTKDHAQMGKHAVACDPWFPAVFPVTDIPSYLNTYTCYELNNYRYNLINSFNPSYHEWYCAYLLTQDHGVDVDLKPGTPLNDFILTVIANNTLTARELFTLCSLIRNRIKQALELSLITEDMLTQLCHPLFIIKTVFIDTNWQSKLINGDLSLLALDVQRSKDLCSASKIGRFSFFANVSSINSVSHEYTRLLQIA